MPPLPPGATASDAARASFLAVLTAVAGGAPVAVGSRPATTSAGRGAVAGPLPAAVALVGAAPTRRRGRVISGVARTSPLWRPLRLLAGTAAWHHTVMTGLTHARDPVDAEAATALWELGLLLLGGGEAAAVMRKLGPALGDVHLLHVVAGSGEGGPCSGVRLRLAASLIKLAHDVDVPDALTADTPLHRAVRAGDCAMVQLLVGPGAGANPLRPNLEGVCALEQAAAAIAEANVAAAAVMMRAMLASPALAAIGDFAASADGDADADVDVDPHVRRAFIIGYDAMPVETRGAATQAAVATDSDDEGDVGGGSGAVAGAVAGLPHHSTVTAAAAQLCIELLQRWPSLRRLKLRADDPADVLHRRRRSARDWLSVAESELATTLFLAVDEAALQRGLHKVRKRLQALERCGDTASDAFDDAAEELARLEQLDAIVRERARAAAAVAAAEAPTADEVAAAVAEAVTSSGSAPTTTLPPPPPPQHLRRDTSGFEAAWSAPLPATALAWSTSLRRDSSSRSDVGLATPPVTGGTAATASSAALVPQPPPSAFLTGTSLRRTSTRIVRQLLRLATPSAAVAAAGASGGAQAPSTTPASTSAGLGGGSDGGAGEALRLALTVLGSLPPGLRPLDPPDRPFRETARSLLYRFVWPGQGVVVLKEAKAASGAERELQAQLALTARLRAHDNIMLPLGFGPMPSASGTSPVLRLAYPYCELGSWRDYAAACTARGETISLRLKLRVLWHVARGMAYLNDQSRVTGRVVHCNLHSGNVLLAGSAGEPTAKVADFAFARLLDGVGGGSSGGGRAGLPVCASGVAPETLSLLPGGGSVGGAGGASGRRPPVGSALARVMTAATAPVPPPSFDERVDVYHYGGLVFEVLAQAPPYSGMSDADIVAVAVQRRMQLAGMATLRRRLLEAGVAPSEAAARAAEAATAEALVALGVAPTLTTATHLAVSAVAAAVAGGGDPSCFTPPRLHLVGTDAIAADSPLRTVSAEAMTLLALLEACLSDDPAMRPDFIGIAETLAALQPIVSASGASPPPPMQSPSELMQWVSVLREEIKPGHRSRLYEALDAADAAAAILPLNPASGRREWALRGALADFVRESAASAAAGAGAGAGGHGGHGGARRYAATRVMALLECIDNAKKHRAEVGAALERHELANSVFHHYLPILTALHRYLCEHVDAGRLPLALAPLLGASG